MKTLASMSTAMLLSLLPVNALPQSANPPSQVVVQGACPFEGCQYGTWTATEAARLFAKVNGPILERQIQTGERVVALSGEVHATPQKATVTGTYKSDEEQGMHVGSTVYFLFPLGEGAARVWHDGKLKDGSMDLALKFEPTANPSKTWVWWVKIRMGDGTTGWLKDPSRFEGMDRFG